MICFAVVFSNLDRLLREQHAGNVALRIDNNQYLAKCREVFSVMRSTRAVSHPIVSKKKRNWSLFCFGYSRALKAQSTISIIMIFVSRFSDLCKSTPHFAWQKICHFGLTWDASISNDGYIVLLTPNTFLSLLAIQFNNFYSSHHTDCNPRKPHPHSIVTLTLQLHL